MKKVLLLLLVGLFLASCSEKNLLTDSESKKEVSFLKLPAADSKLARNVSFSAIIDGQSGGQIPIYHSYETAEGKTVTISGNLDIPANAFEGTKNIVINLDDEYAVIDFSPSPTHFAIPLRLNLFYSGLNLQGLEKGKVNFFYISDDGNIFELIKSQNNVFNPQSGTIGTIKAELNHFSRFGWVI